MKRISAGHLVSGGSGTGRGYGKFGFFKFAKGAASIITTSGVPPHPRICMACLTANTPAAIRADASIKPTRSLPPLNAGQSWVDVPPLHHRHLHPWPPSSSNHLPPACRPGVLDQLQAGRKCPTFARHQFSKFATLNFKAHSVFFWCGSRPIHQRTTSRIAPFTDRA